MDFSEHVKTRGIIREFSATLGKNCNKYFCSSFKHFCENYRGLQTNSLMHFRHGQKCRGELFAGVYMEWPSMKVIITITLCYSNLWKSKFMVWKTCWHIWIENVGNSLLSVSFNQAEVSVPLWWPLQLIWSHFTQGWHTGLISNYTTNSPHSTPNPVEPWLLSATLSVLIQLTTNVQLVLRWYKTIHPAMHKCFDPVFTQKSSISTWTQLATF